MIFSSLNEIFDFLFGFFVTLLIDFKQQGE